MVMEPTPLAILGGVMEFEEKFDELLPHMPDWSVVMVKHFGRHFWQAATERAAEIVEMNCQCENDDRVNMPCYCGAAELAQIITQQSLKK